jgi:hypothetical protein
VEEVERRSLGEKKSKVDEWKGGNKTRNRKKERVGRGNEKE